MSFSVSSSVASSMSKLAGDGLKSCSSLLKELLEGLEEQGSPFEEASLLLPWSFYSLS